MDYSPTIEPAYLNLPGWRCLPVYAVPFNSTSRETAADFSQIPLEAHNLISSNMPQDPRQWTKQNVTTWLEWCVENFSLPSLDIEKFHMNGRGLCLLTKNDLLERAPTSGDILYNALQVLLGSSKEKSTNNKNNSNGLISANVSLALLQHVSQDKSPSSIMGMNTWSRSISSDFHSMGHVIQESEQAHAAASQNFNGSDVDSTTTNSPPLPVEETIEKSLLSSDSSTNVNQGITPLIGPLLKLGDITNENSTEKVNVRLLWDFLQQLLNDSQQRYTGCIVWRDKNRGIFKITDPHRLAALWGKQKNHLNMNFDKMSRALRYYYRVRILQKEPGERHCYRFLRHPNELRHCKQRALLTKDPENGHISGLPTECPDIESALDMSIKIESSPQRDVE